jgi:dienelactone hydrolase
MVQFFPEVRLNSSIFKLIKGGLVAPVILALSSLTQAEIVTKEVSYEVEGESFTGFIAYDDKIEGQRPGVIVVHEWWGHNDYARTRAMMLAELGYVGFALDMYGTGVLAEHPDDANKFMMASFEKAGAIKARFETAMSLLQAEPMVAEDDIGAIGYCYGGAVVLSMARAGLPLDAVASFHGSLSTPAPAQAGAIQGRVMAFTGADDPMVPPEQVAGFKAEMEAAGADFGVVSYEGAVHSFTNPGATAVGEQFDMPLRYDAKADEDSWAQASEMFDKAFK